MPIPSLSPEGMPSFTTSSLQSPPSVASVQVLAPLLKFIWPPTLPTDGT